MASYKLFLLLLELERVGGSPVMSDALHPLRSGTHVSYVA